MFGPGSQPGPGGLPGSPLGPGGSAGPGGQQSLGAAPARRAPRWPLWIAALLLAALAVAGALSVLASRSGSEGRGEPARSSGTGPLPTLHATAAASGATGTDGTTRDD